MTARELTRAVVIVVYLGACYSNLWPSVDVNATVGFPGDGASHCVGDAYSQSPSLLTVVQGQEAVSSLPCRVVKSRKHSSFCNLTLLTIKC